MLYLLVALVKGMFCHVHSEQAYHRASVMPSNYYSSFQWPCPRAFHRRYDRTCCLVDPFVAPYLRCVGVWRLALTAKQFTLLRAYTFTFFLLTMEVCDPIRSTSPDPHICPNLVCRTRSRPHCDSMAMKVCASIRSSQLRVLNCSTSLPIVYARIIWGTSPTFQPSTKSSLKTIARKPERAP